MPVNSATLDFDAAAFLSTLTNKPGVYRMLDAERRVLYVGKARNLKNRVASYFREPARLTVKTRALMSHTRAVEVTVTHTETEALILENNLIKELQPRYNILLRDDKSFPYIYLSTNENFPRLGFHRGTRTGRGRYFGPYPSANSVRDTLSLLQKLFRIRQCENSFFSHRTRPCLQYQIQRCTAPCVGLVDEETYWQDIVHAIMFLEGRSEEVVDELVKRMETASRSLDFELAVRYRDQIMSLRRVQERQYVSGARGDIDVIASRSRDGVGVVQVFCIREGQNLGNKTLIPSHTGGAGAADILEAFLPQYYLSRPSDRPVPGEILVSEALQGTELLAEVLSKQAGRKVTITHRVRGERARWLAMAVNNTELVLAQRLANQSTLQARIDALQAVLELDEPLGRIECFDVSHTQGEATVASCVVFGPEGPLKSDYRRFNIDDIQPGDDYGAMRQALTRRYTRLRREDGKLPDVLLVDGGKGQLTQAIEVLQELQVNTVTVVGVAKGPSRKPGFESLFLSHRETAFLLPPDSAALHLIQQVRDEAHRFAVTGHRSRRSRGRKTSTLEHIPGIGVKRRQRLLSEFGGLQGVARAGVEDLLRIKGISRMLAQAIYDSFHDSS